MVPALRESTFVVPLGMALLVTELVVQRGEVVALWTDTRSVVFRLDTRDFINAEVQFQTPMVV